jgi:hypothetical protein
MDANSGEPWSEMDISDLTNEIAHGRTMAETASFLCRDEDEVRRKAKELRLVVYSSPLLPCAGSISPNVNRQEGQAYAMSPSTFWSGLILATSSIAILHLG